MVITIATLLFVAACTSSPEEVQAVVELDTFTLSVVDSIGVSAGDSNYVFGAIYAVENGPDGSVFMLDACDNTIIQYDSSGAFVRLFGGAGSGPGELNMPGYFTVNDRGNPYVIDANCFVMYNYDGSLLLQKNLSQIEHPQSVEAMPGGQILGVLSEYDIRDEDEHFIVNRIALWQDSTPESPIVYFNAEEYDLSHGDFMTNITKIDYFPMLFTGSGDDVYIAPDPVNSPLIYRFNTVGSCVDTLTLPYVVVPKTEQELLDEKLFIEHAVYTNSFGNVSLEWEPESDKPMIKSLGIGSNGCLWVQRGNEPTPTFDIINSDGEIVGIASLPGREDTSYWHFEIDPSGIIAYDKDPEDYQRIFILEVE